MVKMLPCRVSKIYVEIKNLRSHKCYTFYFVVKFISRYGFVKEFFRPNFSSFWCVLIINSHECQL